VEKKEVLLENLEVDVRPRARTYDPKCDRELYFHQPSHSSCFLILELFY
jgi:hypothetical protein